MYVEQRTETTTASPATFVVKMSRAGLGYSAHSHTPIVSEDHLFMSLCPLQISASNKQLKGALLAGYVISLSVLLESWTYLSGERDCLSLSHRVKHPGKYFHVDLLPIFTTCNSLHLTRPDCRD